MYEASCVSPCRFGEYTFQLISFLGYKNEIKSLGFKKTSLLATASGMNTILTFIHVIYSKGTYADPGKMMSTSLLCSP